MNESLDTMSKRKQKCPNDEEVTLLFQKHDKTNYSSIEDTTGHHYKNSNGVKKT